MIYVYGKLTGGNTCSTTTNVLTDSAFKTNNIIDNRFFNTRFFIVITLRSMQVTCDRSSYLIVLDMIKLMSSFTYKEQILQLLSVHSNTLLVV